MVSVGCFFEKMTNVLLFVILAAIVLQCICIFSAVADEVCAKYMINQNISGGEEYRLVIIP